MHYQSLYIFYWFGTCLRYLQDASPASKTHGDGHVVWNIEQLFAHLDTLTLPVTARLGHRKLDQLLAQLKAKPEDSFLTAEEAQQLSQAINELRDTLESEIEGVGAYTPTPKRLDLSRLISDVSSLFAPQVFNNLPTIAQFDLHEAGKCIAFERSTAAAFHILRATEGALRFYYSKMIRRGRVNSQMWGPIVTDLRVHALTKKHEALNNHLDNIRVSFRNPTQHPEAIYDIHEVQDLWAVCVDVINRMVRTMANESRL